MGKYEYASSAPVDTEYNITDAVKVIPAGYSMDESFTPIIVAGFAIIKIWPASAAHKTPAGRVKGVRYCVIRTKHCQSPLLRKPSWFPTAQAAKVSILAWVSTGHSKRRTFTTVDKHWQSVYPLGEGSGE